MNSLSYLLKNSTLRLAVYGVGILSAFIVTPHMLHSMGNDLYGIWVLIISLFPYFAVLNFATSNSISTIYAKALETNDTNLIERLLVAAIQLGMLSLLSTLLIAFSYYFLEDTEYSKYVSRTTFILTLLIFAFSMGTYNLLNVSHGFLAGRMGWNLLSLTSLGRLLFSSISALIFIQPTYSADRNLLSMCYISSGSFLLEAALNIFLMRKHLFIPAFHNFFTNPFKSELFQISSSLSIIVLGRLLRNSTQVYMINAFFSSSTVTLYSLTKQIISYMNDLIASAFDIMTPYFSKLQSQNNLQASQETLLTSIFLSTSITSIVALGLTFYGDLFFQRWLGDDFSSVQILLTPMALAGLLELGPIASSSFLISIRQQKVLAKMTVCEGVTTFILTALGLLLFDLSGVGWGVFITTLLFRTIWLPLQICKFSNLSHKKYYINLALALFPQCAAQYVYYLFIKDYVTATYTSIILAGVGQSIIAITVLISTTKLLALCKK